MTSKDKTTRITKKEAKVFISCSILCFIIAIGTLIFLGNYSVSFLFLGVSISTLLTFGEPLPFLSVFYNKEGGYSIKGRLLGLASVMFIIFSHTLFT
jgi:hypothetical protein